MLPILDVVNCIGNDCRHQKLLLEWVDENLADAVITRSLISNGPSAGNKSVCMVNLHTMYLLEASAANKEIWIRLKVRKLIRFLGHTCREPGSPSQSWQSKVPRLRYPCHRICTRHCNDMPLQ
jgi:hypothetical protein